MEVDLVRVDFVGVDLVGGHQNKMSKHDYRAQAPDRLIFNNEQSRTQELLTYTL